MIIYDLICENTHRFEGWFRNKEDYEHQLTKGILLCPVCHCDGIKKLPSASYINTRSGADDASTAPDPQANTPLPDAFHLVKAVQKVIHEKLNSEQFDNVGDEFANEVRKIHYGEADERNVYGSATTSEIAELGEEGIETFSLPLLPDKKKLN